MNGSQKRLHGVIPPERPLGTGYTTSRVSPPIPPRAPQQHRGVLTSMITEPERGDTFAAPNYQQFKTRSARAGSGDGIARGVQFPPSFSTRKAK